MRNAAKRLADLRRLRMQQGGSKAMAFAWRMWQRNILDVMRDRQRVLDRAEQLERALKVMFISALNTAAAEQEKKDVHVVH